ncbi:MAG: AraC family transcriptional regulator [Lachnospiraceae bacterium]|nr:AraC family transcriptional regulator [Lachnospiraceae bacterium]
MQLEKEWVEKVSDDGREAETHRHQSEEIMFFRAVAEGNISHVQENCDRRTFADMNGVGRLSDDPVTNLKYHFIVTAALAVRFCSEGGMPMEESFSLSDFYIRKLDGLRSGADVVLMHDKMVLDYTGRMLALRKHKASSQQVADAVDYVYAHILERITVDDMAKDIGASPTYLSRIFKQEMGISISDYVRSRKIEMAKNMLRYTDYSMVEIANKLAFSSQSHFIQQFRSIVGETPKAYRDENYMIALKKASDGENDLFVIP